MAAGQQARQQAKTNQRRGLFSILNPLCNIINGRQHEDKSNDYATCGAAARKLRINRIAYRNCVRSHGVKRGN